MIVIPEFYLYGTEACHLCEEAKAVIADLHDQMRERFASQDREKFFIITDIDISDFDALVDAYGSKIPVLLSHDKSRELCWPFDVVELYQFMSASIQN